MKEKRGTPAAAAASITRMLLSPQIWEPGGNSRRVGLGRNGSPAWRARGEQGHGLHLSAEH